MSSGTNDRNPPVATDSASTVVPGSSVLAPEVIPPTDLPGIPPIVGAPTSYGGRFRIVRPHARGGLGEVFVAKDEELGREVALKQIQSRHADHPQSRARFMLEAEITGGLEHPGIVPVYGLGTYADGRPYYAMRFIRGDSLAEKIKRFHKSEGTNRDEGVRTLELHKLLRRLIDVCEAIQYAHDRGILHRDLKPGNIMLGKYGETLVVDWGLAKALSRGDRSPDLSDSTATESDEPPLIPSSGSGSAPTQMGSAVGTPAYMSPEQAAGRLDELGPATDVYSLGATLYHLLTGQPPFQRAEFPPPRSLKKDIPKPLEAICLKAMALKPSDRYPTPAQLRIDLEHWLADEPVSATTESFVERSARFVRKHKSWALATATSLLLVALTSTAAAVLINQQKNENAELAANNLKLAKDETGARKDAQANTKRADEQSALALKTLNTVIYSIQNELAEIPAARPVRQKLLDKALTGLQAVAGAEKVSREASRSQLFAHDQLGNLFSLLGSPQAVGEYQQAHNIALRLAKADPTNALAQRDLQISYQRLGDVSLELGNVPEAKKHYEQSLDITRRLAEADPANAQAQRALSISHEKLGDVGLKLGNVPEAKKHYEQDLKISRRLAEADPANVQAQRDLCASYNNLGEVGLALGNVPEAKKHFEQGLDFTRRLAEADPANAEAQRDLSVSYQRLGDASLRLGNVPEAKKHFEQGLDITRRLAEADPANAEAQRDLSVSYLCLGNVSMTSGNVPEAKQRFEKGLEISRRLAEADPANARAQRELSVFYCWLGNVSGVLGNLLEAKKHFEEYLVISRRLADADPANAEVQRDLSISYEKLGTVSLTSGNLSEAKQHFEQGLEIRRRLAEADPANAQVQADLAFLHWNLARTEMAVKNYSTAKDHLTTGIAILARLEANQRIKEQPDWASLLHEQRELLVECEGQLAATKE